MYRIRPCLYIRIRCEDEWSGTIQELYETDAKPFDSKDDLTKLIHEYASHELVFDDVALQFMYEGFGVIKVETVLRRNTIGCLVEIYASQRNTWQGVFRNEGMTTSFKNDTELFSLMHKAHLRMLVRKKEKKKPRHSSKTMDRSCVAEHGCKLMD